jgi:hypothetical protein
MQATSRLPFCEYGWPCCLDLLTIHFLSMGPLRENPMFRATRRMVIWLGGLAFDIHSAPFDYRVLKLADRAESLEMKFSLRATVHVPEVNGIIDLPLAKDSRATGHQSLERLAPWRSISFVKRATAHGHEFVRFPTKR